MNELLNNIYCFLDEKGIYFSCSHVLERREKKMKLTSIESN